MRTTYYTHACFQMVTAQGVRLLCDPWTYNPVSNALWQFPECPIPAATFTDQDVLYISHNHVDHFCPRTLAHFSRDIPIVIRRYGDLDNPIKPTLVGLGFQTIIEVAHGETRTVLKDLTLSLYADLSTFDSAIVVSDGQHEVFHQNDCMLSLEDARRIGNLHKIELALLGLVNSSIYPTFFVMDPETKRSETAVRKQKVIDRTSDYAEAVGASFVIPCASDMVYIRFPASDPFLGPHAVEFQADARARGRSFEVIPMSPGDVFDLDAPGQNYRPAYDSHEDLEAQLAALRLRPDIRAVFEAIEAWEDYDHQAFCRQFEDYCRHLTHNFQTLLEGQLRSTSNRIFRVRLVLKSSHDNTRAIEIAVDYGGLTIGMAQTKARLDPEGVDMDLVFEDRYLGMLMAGAMEFDDIRSGWMDIHRPGPFSPEEIAFWHIMMLFSAWRREAGLAQTTEAFKGQISSVFGSLTRPTERLAAPA